MKVFVKLTQAELREAAIGGVDRRLSALAMNRRSTHPETPDHLQHWYQTSIVGAIGELAVAKALGLRWDPTIGRIDATDVGNYEVRTTEQPNPVLRIRAHDNAAKTFLLCQYWRDRVLIHGWTLGQRVIDLDHMEFENCWSAPADTLYSMADLNTEIAWSEHVVPYGVTV